MTVTKTTYFANQHPECEKTPQTPIATCTYDPITGIYRAQLSRNFPNFQGLKLESNFYIQIEETLESLVKTQEAKFKRHVLHKLSVPTMQRLKSTNSLEIKTYSSTEAIAEWSILRKRLYDLGGFPFLQTSWHWVTSEIENGEVVNTIMITDNSPLHITQRIDESV